MANDQASSKVKSAGQPATESHAELLAKIESLFPAEFHEINPTSFSSRSKRITTLLANKDPQHAIQSRSEWLSFDLLEIQFLVRVELIVDGFNSYDNFEFSYVDSFGGETRYAYRLFGNSELLLEFFLSDKHPPIGEYLLSRLPYVIVNAAILAVSYTLLRRMFAEIIAINRRKQDLHKVSIIATDVSFASLQGLPIDEETTYHLRTQTKMELLKEHLRQHMSDDYSYGKHDSGISRMLEAARKKLDTKIDGDGESSP